MLGSSIPQSKTAAFGRRVPQFVRSFYLSLRVEGVALSVYNSVKISVYSMALCVTE